MSTQVQKTKGLRIATRCTSIDQFVAAFNRFAEPQTFFVSTLATRPVGLETAFSIDLADGVPALRGLGFVVDSWETAENPFGRPGVQLGIRRLTADSVKVYEQLLVARAIANDSMAAPLPTAQNDATSPTEIPTAAAAPAITPPAPRAAPPATTAATPPTPATTAPTAATPPITPPAAAAPEPRAKLNTPPAMPAVRTAAATPPPSPVVPATGAPIPSVIPKSTSTPPLGMPAKQPAPTQPLPKPTATPPAGTATVTPPEPSPPPAGSGQHAMRPPARPATPPSGSLKVPKAMTLPFGSPVFNPPTQTDDSPVIVSSPALERSDATATHINDHPDKPVEPVAPAPTAIPSISTIASRSPFALPPSLQPPPATAKSDASDSDAKPTAPIDGKRVDANANAKPVDAKPDVKPLDAKRPPPEAKPDAKPATAPASEDKPRRGLLPTPPAPIAAVPQEIEARKLPPTPGEEKPVDTAGSLTALPIPPKSLDEGPSVVVAPQWNPDPTQESRSGELASATPKLQAFAAPMPERVPGSDYILPANPLSGITDESLEGFVDCTLFEETGNFFPVEGVDDPNDPNALVDPPAPPPLLRPITASHPVAAPPPGYPRGPSTGGHAAVEVTQRAPTTGAYASVELRARTTGGISTAFADEEPSVVVAADTPAFVVDKPPHERYPTVPPQLAQQYGAFPPEHPVAIPGHYRREATAEVGPRAALDLQKKMLIAAAAAGGILLMVIVFIVARGDDNDAKPSPKPAAPLAKPAPPAPASDPQSPDVTEVTPQARAVLPEPQPEPEEPNVAGTPLVGEGPCRLTVVTTPAGSLVQLDGQNMGPSPLTVDGPCRKRQLTVSHQRYQTQTRWVTPTADKAESIDVVLPRPTHRMMIETNPLGATISIAGRRAGTSPTVVEVMGFSSIAVSISKPGYQPMTKRVYSKSPNDKLFVKLNKK